MKQLLLLLLLPALVNAQEVTPVVSNDYLTLIHADSLPVKNFMPDTMNNFTQAKLLMKRNQYYGFKVGSIKIRRGVLTIEPHYQKTLWLSGQFNTRVEIKRVNQLPALQSQYVQGRAQNGALTWRGAETGEPFSYGPDVRSLEYDGASYAYDENGKLVPAGTGNAQAANQYNNSIFRTASLLSQSLRLTGQLRMGSAVRLNTTVKLGHSTENTFIKYNRNGSRNAAAAVEATWRKLNFSGGYTYLRDEFSNSNRNGFLNRVYQNALLTPVSFSNAQNNRLANTQQAYSNIADNSLYQLTDNGNRFLQTHQTGNLVIEDKMFPFKFRLTQSVEYLHQGSREGYKPGSVNFPGGIAIDRNRNDQVYLLDGTASCEIPFYDSDFGGTAGMHYKFNSNRSSIGYNLPAMYRYQRSAQDASLYYEATFHNDPWDIGLNLANKAYISNTVTNNSYLLPNVTASVKYYNYRRFSSLSVKLSGSYNRFNSELPVSRSFAANSLTQFNTQQAFQFFPVQEVTGFDNLAPIQHKEWNGRLELSYKSLIFLYGEIFNRTTIDDVLPVVENNQFVLRNMATHRNRGVELGISMKKYGRKMTIENSLSYFSYRNKVTDVKPGYNYTAMAGFSNIHTAVVKGAALGSIAGTSYLRDDNNNILIGNDGFPLVNNTPVVIGNPIPDFTMKMNNDISWKMFSLNLGWEWRKGGQVWNGTQAVLDYYGRSAGSAAQRTVTGHVFTGLLQDKQPNTQPVAFYDVNKPVEQNRWTRYGHSGIGEEYIQDVNVLRLNNIGVGCKLRIKRYIQQLALSLYAQNLLLYSSYKGADPTQLLYEQSNAAGLDFFNLPSLKSFGCNISIQF